MKRLRLIMRILRETGADAILGSFIGFLLLCALVIWIMEPEIRSYWDAVWYCFAVVTTIGFGDVVVRTFIARAISMILSCYAVIALAIITGVVVNYFTQVIELRKKDSLTALVDKLERLPELSREELEELSERIRRWDTRSDKRG